MGAGLRRGISSRLTLDPLHLLPDSLTSAHTAASLFTLDHGRVVGFRGSKRAALGSTRVVRPPLSHRVFFSAYALRHKKGVIITCCSVIETDEQFLETYGAEGV